MLLCSNHAAVSVQRPHAWTEGAVGPPVGVVARACCGACPATYGGASTGRKCCTHCKYASQRCEEWLWIPMGQHARLLCTDLKACAGLIIPAHHHVWSRVDSGSRSPMGPAAWCRPHQGRAKASSLSTNSLPISTAASCSQDAGEAKKQSNNGRHCNKETSSSLTNTTPSIRLKPSRTHNRQ